MQSAVSRAARAAQAAGAQVTEIKLPSIMADAYTAWNTIQDYEGACSLAYEHDHHRDKLSAALLELLDRGRATPPADYDDARRTTKRARMALSDLFGGFDVILSASAPGAALHGLASTGTSTFNRLWTLMGTPCVNVPGILDDTGLPLGVQVIGRFGGDHAALQAAHFIETALGKQS
jgi:Asp-tRNA(Asn)/Glu-tRNA(Gln) amidotransferase A subunit family amidase